jgi:hypothetical protein
MISGASSVSVHAAGDHAAAWRDGESVVDCRLMRTGLAISALCHAAIVVCAYAMLASPRLFDARSAEAITVDIVSAQDFARPEPTAKSGSAPEPAPEPTPQAAATSASPAPPSPSVAAAHDTAPLGPAQQMLRLEPPAGEPTAAPAEPPMPEATRLASLLHVPTPDGAPEPHKQGFEAPAIAKAKLTPDEIAAFRKRVKQCWTAPAGLSARQRLRLVIRLTLKPDGALSSEPMLLEASASPQGPVLLKSLLAALQHCQPYTVLPPQKYKEWRVLDVGFSPQDLLGS